MKNILFFGTILGLLTIGCNRTKTPTPAQLDSIKNAQADSTRRAVAQADSIEVQLRSLTVSPTK